MTDRRAMRELQAFTASAVHALRTPLAALSGEVELALRRDRHPDAYRAALARIGERVAELTDLTEDIAILGQPGDVAGVSKGVSSLRAVLTAVVPSGTAAEIEWGGEEGDVPVVGARRFLARALALIVEQAARYGGPHTRISWRVDRPTSDAIDVHLAATPRLVPDAWRQLQDDGDGAVPVNAAGFLRLRTAARIVEHCGGSVDREDAEGQGAVRIRLRRAPIGIEGVR